MNSAGHERNPYYECSVGGAATPTVVSNFNLPNSSNNLFLGSRELKEQYSPEAPNQSPPHMVPSPVTPAASPAAQGLYSPPHQGIIYNPSITISNDSDELSFLKHNGEDSMGLHLENPNAQHQMLSPYQQVPSPSSNGQCSPLGGQMSHFTQEEHSPSPAHTYSPVFERNVTYSESDTAIAQICRFDAVQEQVIHSKSQEFGSQWDFCDLGRGPSDNINLNEDIDLLAIVSDRKFLTTLGFFNDIQADSSSSQAVKQESQNPVLNKDLAFKAATVAADCLQLYKYKATGDLNLLVPILRYLIVKQIHQGNNSLHDAILSQNKDVFNKILEASRDYFSVDLITAQNCNGETLLHLAVRGDDLEMVKRLLVTPGCNVNLVDADGNTALHIAASTLYDFLDVILAHISTCKDTTVSKVINLYNYEGQTSLHLAIIRGCLESVKLLLNHSADAHMCDRKHGINPIQLSVSHQNIAKFLIEKTSITVDAGLLLGNTAVHISLQAKDEKMWTLLTMKKANPLAKNSLRNTADEEKDDSCTDEETEEEEDDSCTDEETEEEEDDSCTDEESDELETSQLIHYNPETKLYGIIYTATRFSDH